ncbi:DENN domain protein [Sesbania bispinosa]|nr:DENN domain protein [Sesbania bispinosa]
MSSLRSPLPPSFLRAPPPPSGRLGLVQLRRRSGLALHRLCHFIFRLALAGARLCSFGGVFSDLHRSVFRFIVWSSRALVSHYPVLVFVRLALHMSAIAPMCSANTKCLCVT